MIYLRFLLLSVVHVSLYAQSADPAASTEQSKLFKIGFEFQEAHHMCPWAIESPEVQSKPIFSVYLGERVLWDLTIDWQDLEFVTMPITNNELDILRITMSSLQTACDALVELNQNATNTDDLTFNKWIDNLKKKLENGNSDPGISTPKVKKSDINSGSFRSFQFPVSPGERFDFIFQPQITIQHHFSYSINLYLGLFVNGIKYEKEHGYFNLNKSHASYINPFLKNINFFNIEDGSDISFSKKHTSEEGFLFLHILTCVDLSHKRTAPMHYQFEERFEGSSSETIDMCYAHEKTGQVNAKSSVNFLSRRPFSSMWKDIKPNQNYAIFLTEKVKKEFLDALTTKFDQMNYGEIFFTEDGERMDLTQCDSFAKKLKDPNIQFLLAQGILTLEFVRTVDPGFLQNYFNEAVKSISNPEQTSRCVFDRQTATLTTTAVTNDLLSPPHLTSEKDAMGAFKDEVLKKEKYEPTYGEAIVEVRMIARIPPDVLKRITILMKCDYNAEMQNYFLSKSFSLVVDRKVEYDLHAQTKGLFLYIEQLLIGGYDE